MVRSSGFPPLQTQTQNPQSLEPKSPISKSLISSYVSLSLSPSQFVSDADSDDSRSRRKKKSRSSRRRSRKSESVGDSESDELSEDIHDGLQDEPWEERTLHLLYNSKIDQDFSIAKVQKSGRKKHKVRWMSKRAMAIPQVIIEL
ncbi:uncharacterized protein LOC114265326 [Camellia sinensis]|uniref:uncharacterized protein LOC114265326 n=1 Tax=Camellia sinensis TaxID=4442 RepID=UPI0010367702|nr:uncharacterized protein LOC114265326 [Camellia sinensis]